MRDPLSSEESGKQVKERKIRITDNFQIVKIISPLWTNPDFSLHSACLLPDLKQTSRQQCMCKQLIPIWYQPKSHKIPRLWQSVMAPFFCLPHNDSKTPTFFILLLNCSCQYLDPLVLIQNWLDVTSKIISQTGSHRWMPKLMGERLWGTDLHNVKVSPHKPLIKKIIFHYYF